MKEIKVVELFAGVGGFRLGLEKASKKYRVVWSNQWEPTTKSQEASEIYLEKFGSEDHSNVNITKVATKDTVTHYPSKKNNMWVCDHFSAKEKSNDRYCIDKSRV